MLQQINLATEEEIQKSNEVCKELEDSGIANVKRNELLAELDRLTGKVLRKINNEILEDLNNLEPLFSGRRVKKIDEPYQVEVDNLEKVNTWGWQVEVVNGEKMMFDPYAENPKYEKIPEMKVEKLRTIYACETNREQVFKIKELIMNFWEKCKNEFKHISIDRILDEKRKVELKIASVDRSIMKKENLTRQNSLILNTLKTRPK